MWWNQQCNKVPKKFVLCNARHTISKIIELYLRFGVASTSVTSITAGLSTSICSPEPNVWGCPNVTGDDSKSS